VKPTVRRRKNDAVIVRLLAPLLPEHLMHRIILISKSSSILDACSKALPCRRGWVASGHHAPKMPISHVFIPASDMPQIHGWHDKGVAVGVYTVNRADLARELLDMGADLIETDYFSRLAHALG
ncbi:MAG: glycerophosphodiester phosphodiesterase, partial [Mariprofundaceae bacterium]